MVKDAKILYDANVILAWLKRGNAACNQKQIAEGTGLSPCYVSWALTHLVNNGKVTVSKQPGQRGAMIRYYSPVMEETPASSVKVK